MGLAEFLRRAVPVALPVRTPARPPSGLRDAEIKALRVPPAAQGLGF